METHEMTPEKSLQIINDAIEKSRRDFEKNAGYPMIIWGTEVLIFAIAVFIMLWKTGNASWNFLWFGIPVTGWPISSILLKDRCRNGGKSFLSRSIGQIWLTYGIFATVLCVVFAFTAPHLTGYITAVLLGFSAAITGLVLKNRFITAGGFLTGLGCTIAMFFVQNWIAPLFFAAGAVLNLIIPGVMMNKKAE